MILHITTAAEWKLALGKGEYTAPSLAAEGFIHCSTAEQAANTANAYFKGREGLVLLCIDEKRLIPEIRYEGAAGPIRPDHAAGDLFPHVYGPLNLTAVIQVLDFPPGKNGFFTLPAELSR